MALRWERSTNNRWVAYVVRGVSVIVERNRSWKSIRGCKPWKVVVFGNAFICHERFDYMDDAQREAEAIARSLVEQMAAAFAADPPDPACECGHVDDEHGGNPEYPGSMACNVDNCDCIAYEPSSTPSDTGERLWG